MDYIIGAACRSDRPGTAGVWPVEQLIEEEEAVGLRGYSLSDRWIVMEIPRFSQAMVNTRRVVEIRTTLIRAGEYRVPSDVYLLVSQPPSYSPYYSRDSFVTDAQRYRAHGPHAGHKLHLCEIVAAGSLSLDQVKSLVRDPKFICRSCGRAAANELHLCDPVPMEPKKPPD